MKVLGVPVGHKEFIHQGAAADEVSRTIKIVGEDSRVASLEFLRGNTFQLLVENSVSRAHCRVRCRT